MSLQEEQSLYRWSSSASSSDDFEDDSKESPHQLLFPIPEMEKTPSHLLIGDNLPSGLPRSREYLPKEIQGIENEMQDLEDMYEEYISRDDLLVASKVELLLGHLNEQRIILVSVLQSYKRVDEWHAKTAIWIPLRS